MKKNKFLKLCFLVSTTVINTTIAISVMYLGHDGLVELVFPENRKTDITKNIYTQTNSDVVNKYKSFIEKDKQILKNAGVKSELLNIDINLNYNEKKIEENYKMSFQSDKSLSNTIDYHSEGVQINLGINTFEEKKGIYKAFYNVFESEKKLTSFVFFHEFGHAVSRANPDDAIYQIYTQYINVKNKRLDMPFMQSLRTLHSETFADVFALHMLTTRYPDINIDKVKDMLAGLRSTHGGHTHNTSYSLVSYKIKSGLKIKDIVAVSKDAAYANILSYSEENVKTQSNKKIVNDIESIQHKIQMSRNNYLNNRKLKLDN